ncbi:hypothetical protein [Natronospora cellulosivora (SeqCode)]
MALLNKKKIILLMVVFVILLCLTTFFFKIHLPISMSNKAIQIVNNDDTNQMDYLLKVLEKETNNPYFKYSHARIIGFLARHKVIEEIDSMTKYYYQTHDVLQKRHVIMSLSKMGTMNSVEFLSNELENTNNARIIEAIYRSLFRIYFLENSNDVIQEEIYKAYKNRDIVDERIKLRKNIILYLEEGDLDYFMEIAKIPFLDQENMEYELASILAYEISNKDIIKEDDKFHIIINDLAKNEEYKRMLREYID